MIFSVVHNLPSVYTTCNESCGKTKHLIFTSLQKTVNGFLQAALYILPTECWAYSLPHRHEHNSKTGQYKETYN